MNTFTAQQLAWFYQAVADGGVMSLKKGFSDEPQNNYVGPNMTSPVEYWSIKPAKKIIDMDHLVKSGIDCEFDDKKVPFATIVGPLLAIYTNGNTAHKYQACLHKWQNCRPRMNHKMFHDGGACPLPEGFKVRLMFRDGAAVVTHTYSDLKWVSTGFKVFTSADIIGYEILGLADGWAYPYQESDE